MRIPNIENHLRSNLPIQYPQFTSDWTTATSSSSTSEVVTVLADNTDSDLAVSAGDEVLVKGIIYHNPISQVTLNNSINRAIVQTTEVHEYSEGYSKEIILSGANESEWNGTFTITQVIDRYQLEIKITPAMTSIPTGTYVAEEVNLPRYNSTFEVQSASATQFTYNSINATDGALYGTPEYVKVDKVCVASTIDLDRILESYTKQEVTKIWVFLVAGATSSSRTRDGNIDFEQTYKVGENRIIHTQENLSVFAIFPTQNSVHAVSAQDIARNDLRTALFKLLVGFKPDSSLCDKMNLMYYVADGIETYNNSFYIHRYDFACNLDITANDTYQADSYVVRRIDTDYFNEDTRNLEAADFLSYVGDIPVNTAIPVVTGTPEVGNVLTTDDGTWTNSPTSYTYKWLRDDVAISGATSSTYTLVEADDGSTIKSQVTAINSAGSSIPAESVGTAIGSDPLPIQLGAEYWHQLEGPTSSNDRVTGTGDGCMGWEDRTTSDRDAYQTTTSLEPTFTYPNGPVSFDVDYFTVNHFNTGSEITVAIRFRRTNNVIRFPRLIDNKSIFNSNDGFAIGPTDQVYNSLDIRGGGPTLYTQAVSDFSNWTNLIVTFSGTTCTVYQDGVLQGSGTVEAVSNSTTDISIGSRLSSSSSFDNLQGDMGHNSIYLRVLDSQEITDLNNFMSNPS